MNDEIPAFKRDESKPGDRRILPQNDLDFNLIITDPVIGRSSVDLREFVSEEVIEEVPAGSVVYDHEGKPFTTTTAVKTIKRRNLWDMLRFYTRDLRLANLNILELNYCRHYLDLAGDYLQNNMIKCFIICLRKVSSITETSQSKNGFLRRRQSTKTTEQTFQELNPPKAKIFGGSGNNPGYNSQV